ncbi:hypothetical protein UUU_30880 [Klebsiella pneumoniae subsp. pneumoniae DSM 30104 = JCM 1662 = NBRC 14940]|nr:hypothetical protein HMPREF9538_05390 [Klebsiella sp. MS 92-3]EJK89968.1 hypothetical protein UUU_30880 [Klebsiella pneumoniae subsp. pneumoniae DSM 30104 = JCM 1662 = NBRC 14940]ESB01956.1 hypothetical protein HMPREF1619_01847 [Klebsiella pneumoniae 909957]
MLKPSHHAHRWPTFNHPIYRMRSPVKSYIYSSESRIISVRLIYSEISELTA